MYSKMTATVDPDAFLVKRPWAFRMVRTLLLAAFTLILFASHDLYAARQTPWPRAKPSSISQPITPPAAAPEAPGADRTKVADAPSACAKRLRDAGVVLSTLPDSVGPGECVAIDVVRIEALRSKLGSRVALSPHATMRCPAAEALAAWIRDDVSPALETADSPLIAMGVDASLECRGRNRVAGAKISQHGFGNAIDVNAFTLKGGRVFKLTDVSADKGLRNGIKETACARFTTVLGPGSDGYHEGHIHLDIIERRGGYRLCQWDVRDAKVEIAKVETDEDAVPMPRPRPISAPPRLAEVSAPAVKKPAPPSQRRRERRRW